MALAWAEGCQVARGCAGLLVLMELAVTCGIFCCSCACLVPKACSGDSQVCRCSSPEGPRQREASCAVLLLIASLSSAVVCSCEEPSGRTDGQVHCLFLFRRPLPLLPATVSASPFLPCFVFFSVHLGIPKVRAWLPKPPPGPCEPLASSSCTAPGSAFLPDSEASPFNFLSFLVVFGPRAHLWLRSLQDL